MQITRWLMVLVLGALWAGAVMGAGPEGTEQEDITYWLRVKKAYEDLVSGAMELPEDTKKLVTDDFERIGDWSYQVVTVEGGDAKAVEDTLNALGKERWECFFIERVDGELRLYLKKEEISYLEKASTAKFRK